MKDKEEGEKKGLTRDKSLTHGNEDDDIHNDETTTKKKWTSIHLLNTEAVQNRFTTSILFDHLVFDVDTDKISRPPPRGKSF